MTIYIVCSGYREIRQTLFFAIVFTVGGDDSFESLEKFCLGPLKVLEGCLTFALLKLYKPWNKHTAGVNW